MPLNAANTTREDFDILYEYDVLLRKCGVQGERRPMTAFATFMYMERRERASSEEVDTRVKTGILAYVRLTLHMLGIAYDISFSDK